MTGMSPSTNTTSPMATTTQYLLHWTSAMRQIYRSQKQHTGDSFNGDTDGDVKTNSTVLTMQHLVSFQKLQVI